MENKQNAFVHRIINWGRSNIRDFPWRSSEDPLSILVAEVFLQKTPADRVAARFAELVSEFSRNTEELDERFLAVKFQNLGLAKRIAWLIEARKTIDERFEGKVPKDEKALMSLPGVGTYTANAVMCLAFNEIVSLVDANVIRILTRVFAINDERPLNLGGELQKLASSLVPRNHAKLYNLSLLDLGALVCRRRPLCEICPVRVLCAFHIENSKTQHPNQGSVTN